MESIPSTAAFPRDQHLEEDGILTLTATLSQTQTHTQTLDEPTGRHVAKVVQLHSHDHSLRVVSAPDLMKSKSRMKLPELNRGAWSLYFTRHVS